jgi:hypothetical protein
MRMRLLCCGSILAIAAPAAADHGGPGAIGANGSAIGIISPDTLAQGKGALGFRLTFTQPDDRSNTELAALAGKHVHAHNSDYNLTAALGVAYGVSDRLTLSAELPYMRRDGLREGEHSHVGGTAINEVVELGSVSGIGDASLLGKYRVTGAGPIAFALIAGLKLPTGSTHRESDEGERLETEHQPGTGSWDPIVGAAVGTGMGALRLTASGLYQWSGKGAQRTRLGDRIQGGIALSHRFGPAPHEHAEADHHHDGGAEHEPPHGHASWDAFVEMNGEWEGRQRVDGEIEADSGGRSLWVSPGARYTSASGLSAAFAVSVPLWQDIRPSHSDNDYRLSLSVGRIF